MCRYGLSGPYKDHFACFTCRKSFKKPSVEDGAERFDVEIGEPIAIKCPQCRGEMVDLGLDFKPPKQSDKRQWEKVRILFDHGVTFHSCGCGGPGFRPKELRDVASFLKDNRSQNDGQRLLRQIEERTRGKRRTRSSRA
jgi:hypothetical protein